MYNFDAGAMRYVLRMTQLACIIEIPKGRFLIF